MDQVWKGAALCLIGAVFAALLKKKVPELAILVSMAVITLVGIALVQAVGNILAAVENLMHLGNFPADLFRPLIKTVAIALVSRLGSDLCRDAGEGAMASMLEISGSFGAIIVSLPLFEAVWDMLQLAL